MHAPCGRIEGSRNRRLGKGPSELIRTFFRNLGMNWGSFFIPPLYRCQNDPKIQSDLDYCFQNFRAFVTTALGRSSEVDACSLWPVSTAWMAPMIFAIATLTGSITAPLPPRQSGLYFTPDYQAIRRLTRTIMDNYVRAYLLCVPRRSRACL